MSTVNTNPSTLFGGTWEQIKDTFVLAAGDTYEAGATGGEATHTLTSNEMPSHRHTFTGTAASHSHSLTRPAVSQINNGAVKGVTTGSAWVEGLDLSSSISSTSITPSGTISNTGRGQAHNNMPPYLVAYMWKRTA